MKSVIVIVSGSSGTGKDTLIGKLGPLIIDGRGAEPDPKISILSSIDPVKQFYNDMRLAAGLEAVTEYEERDRIGLAKIKEGLDAGFGFTSGLADAIVTNLPPGSVLLYQIREVTSIEALIELSKMAVGGYRVLWVHVQRDGFNGLQKAPTDRYAPEDVASVDVLVQNTSLEDLDDWAEFIAQRVNKLRSS